MSWLSIFAAIGLMRLSGMKLHDAKRGSVVERHPRTVGEGKRHAADAGRGSRSADRNRPCRFSKNLRAADPPVGSDTNRWSRSAHGVSVEGPLERRLIAEEKEQFVPDDGAAKRAAEHVTLDVPFV